jgi:hypothetical protein
MVMPPLGVGPKLVSVLSFMTAVNSASHGLGWSTLCNDMQLLPVVMSLL